MDLFKVRVLPDTGENPVTVEALPVRAPVKVVAPTETRPDIFPPVI